MKVKTKFIITMSLFMTIVMVSLSILTHVLLKKSTEERYANQMTQSTENITNNLDVWAKDKKEMQFDASKLEIVEKLDVPAILKYTAKLQGTSPDTETNYALISADGNVNLPGEGGSIIKVDISNYTHFKEGMAGKNIIMGPTRSALDNRPMALAVAPVLDEKDKVIGVINGGYYTESLNDVVAKNKVSKGTKVYIINTDGLYVTNEKENKIANEKFTIKELDEQFFTKVLKDLKEKGKGNGEITIKGVEYKVSYQKADEIDWAGVVLVPTSDIYSTVNKVMTMYAVFAVGIILIMIAIITFILNKIFKPLKKINETMGGLENNEGDLTVELEVKSKDEFGELSKGFNGMIRGLKDMVRNVVGKTENMDGSTQILKEQFNEMTKASRNITENIQDAAELSEKQLETYQTSIKNIEDISKNAMNISTVSSEAANGSEEVSSKTKERKKDIDSLKLQMEQINNSVNGSLQMIRELQGKSTEIGGITKIITEIANQTNLLALNASIEAARAGEQGKGFKVVADEVKKLAEQSQKSAEQISHILKEITTETKETTDAMEKGMLEVEKGIQKTNELESDFTTIVEVTDKVSKQIKENFALIEGLVNNIKEIEEITYKNVGITEEMSQYYQMVAASSEEQFSSILTVEQSVKELSRISKELREKMEKFKTEE